MRYLRGILCLWLLSCSTAVPKGTTHAVSQAEHWATSAGPGARLASRLAPKFSGGESRGQAARYLPIVRPFDKYFATGRYGTRGIVSGIRTELDHSGTLRSAMQPLREPQAFALALSERLGGGALFLSGTSIYRSETWLGELVPLLTVLPGTVGMTEGFDRVYLVANGKNPRAFSHKNGELLDVGTWPASVNVSQFFAFDATHALALADGAGLLHTANAGGSWERIHIPVSPVQLTPSGAKLMALGNAADGVKKAYTISPQGSVSIQEDHAPLQPRQSDGSYPWAPSSGLIHANIAPLLMAIEDGFPLVDGTALVAREGALHRIDSDTGTIVESAIGAFPEANAHCHPFVLGSENSRSLVFSCGARFGGTTLYRYGAGSLTLLAAFSDPRIVLGSPTGAIGVRGGCQRNSTSGAHICLIAEDGSRHEIRIDGNMRNARMVPMKSTALAVVVPPHGRMQAARLSVLKNGRTTTMALKFPKVRAELQRSLEDGLWLEGFEERSPGIIGGWVEYQGLVIGVLLDAEGQVSVGQSLTDACTSSVAGAFGFRFCGGQRGFETVDGGMTWRQVHTPEALSSVQPNEASNSRVAGRMGALAGGWARIGWGGTEPPQNKARHTMPPPATLQALRLDCADSQLATHVTTNADFYGTPKPKIAAAELRVSLSVSDVADRFSRNHPAAQIDAWGPKSDGWEDTAVGVIRWLPVFARAHTARSSHVGLLPKVLRTLLRPIANANASRLTTPTPAAFTVGFAADPNHALLAVRHDTGGTGETSLFALIQQRAPFQITRADGEAFGDFEAAFHSNGQWYISTFSGARSTLFALEGSVARSFASLPRVSEGVRGRSATGLALSSNGTHIAWVLEGPSADRSSQDRWLYPVDLRTGAHLPPENLGALSDPKFFRPCGALADGASAYTFETATSSPIILDGPSQRIGTMYNTRIQIRASSHDACLLGIAGSLTSGGELVRGKFAASDLTASIPVSIAIDNGKQLLRCKP